MLIGRPRTSALNGLLDKVAAELSSLAISTERDFLRIGEQLQEIVTRAQEQRSNIAGLVDEVAGKTGESLAGTFKEIVHWTGHTAEATNGAQWLSELASVVRAVRDPLHALNKAVRTLRVMGVVTRIESARLGAQATSFDALARDVVTLAESIDERSNTILDAVNGVCELLLRT
jgi:hypothetical protein